MSILIILVSTFAALALSACGKINDMHDATMHMDSTTSRMADKTDHLSETTDKMLKTTNNMANTTNAMADTTDQLASLTAGMAQTTDNLLGETQQMRDTTDHLATETDQMKNTTDHMASVTEQMNQTTEHVAQLTEQVANLTQQLTVMTNNLQNLTHSTYTDLRQGNSVTLRADALKKMKDSKSLEAKLSFAGVYMQAYEFQLWKNQGTDDQTTLDGLYYQAFIEFFKDEREFQDGNFSVDPTSSDSNMMNMYAIAATMHEVNQNQVEQDSRDNLKQVSVLSLIKDTLRKKAAFESGKIKWDDLKQYEQELLSNEKDAIYLLRLRSNVLGIMLLSKLANLEYEGVSAKIGDLLKGIGADYVDLNLAEIYTYTTWVREAADTRDYLISIGYTPQFDWKLQRLFSLLRLPDTSGLKEPRKSAMNALSTQIQRFRADLSAAR